MIIAWRVPSDKQYEQMNTGGQFVFILLWIPLELSIVGAILAAFIYTIQEWREWPLLIMMGVLALMSAVFLVADEVNQSWYAAGTTLLVLLTLRRFWIRRNREQGGL
jgi:hypothetical protein